MFVEALMLMDDIVESAFKNLLSTDASSLLHTKNHSLSLDISRYSNNMEMNINLMLTSGSYLKVSILLIAQSRRLSTATRQESHEA